MLPQAIPVNQKASSWYFSIGSRVLYYDSYGLKEAVVNEVSGLALKVRRTPTSDAKWIQKDHVSEILPPIT